MGHVRSAPCRNQWPSSWGGFFTPWWALAAQRRRLEPGAVPRWGASSVGRGGLRATERWPQPWALAWTLCCGEDASRGRGWREASSPSWRGQWVWPVQRQRRQWGQRGAVRTGSDSVAAVRGGGGAPVPQGQAQCSSRPPGGWLRQAQPGAPGIGSVKSPGQRVSRTASVSWLWWLGRGPPS